MEETFRYAPQVGFRHWGLGGPFTMFPGLIQWLDVDQVRRRMREAGLESLTEVWTPPIPTTSPEAVELGAQHVALAARVAARLDCHRLVQTGGPRREGGLRRTIEGLQTLLDILDDESVRICLEPHVDAQILYRQDYENIFAEIDTPRLGITVDTGHFHTAGVDTEALIRAHPDKIYNVHIKDHIGAQSVVIGQGEIDLQRLVDVLRDVGYTGPLAIEMEVTDTENLPSYIGPAYRHMAQLLER
jgi:sugar phosphate isomerase/epimerase